METFRIKQSEKKNPMPVTGGEISKNISNFSVQGGSFFKIRRFSWRILDISSISVFSATVELLQLNWNFIFKRLPRLRIPRVSIGI